MKSIIRRKSKSKPQGDGSDPHVAENLLKRDFNVEAPNQKWVTDITQLAIEDTWLYVSAIKDLCSKEIAVSCIKNKAFFPRNDKRDPKALLVKEMRFYLFVSVKP
ncbi:hypothetical protein ACFPYJ_29820 [Paenibacillus solisilvae]|uniref:Integrase catalytic domain-containing protein n=1 Tax=Paenibacillus solisilvae TaxID=2486751 RepID=A0ABW0W953_9BACL